MLKNKFEFVVAYKNNDEIRSKEFANFYEAREAFKKIAKKNLPCKLEYSEEHLPVIMVECHNWQASDESEKEQIRFRKEIINHLQRANVRKDLIDLVMLLPTKTIINTVVAEDPDPFIEIDGIGVKTAYAVIDALKGVFHPIISTDVTDEFHDIVRIRLNPGFGANDTNLWIRDTIRKRWGKLEQLAYSVSKDPNVVIRVNSMIMEKSAPVWDIASQDIAQAKQEAWDDAVLNGLVVDGVTYKHFGHTSNGAKFCDSLFIKEQWYNAVNKEIKADCNPGWKVTPAKFEAYVKGLEMPYGEECEVPFRPEDFEFFPSLELELEDNVAWNTVDGNVTYGKRIVKQNAFDGQIIMHISDKMRNVLIERLMANGETDEWSARIIVKRFIKTLRTHTCRTAGAKMKGAVCTFFDIHKFYRDRGVTTINGRDVDDIIFFADETVLKAGYFGSDAAYANREDWLTNVAPRFAYLKLLKEHDIAKKDVSYQVIQANHKANRETVEKFAEEQAGELNALHMVSGAMRLLSREQQAIARCYPTLMNVRNIQQGIATRFYHKVDKAFAGKRVGTASIAMVFGDVIAMAEHIAGLPVVGCIPVGTAYNRAVKKNAKVAAWRSPQLDPGALRVIDLHNYIDGDNDKYFRLSNSMMLTVWDTTITRVRGDFDGDKMGYSYDPTLIEMINETHRNFGDYLTDWEVFKAPKSVITEELLDEYYRNMVNPSDLGLTCTRLNALYNGIMCNQETGEIKAFDTTYDAVSNLTTKANNLVDASKHGMKSFSDNEDTLVNNKEWKAVQPNAKVYRDKVSELAESLSKGGSREELDKLAKLPEEKRVNTLNVYTGTLSDLVDREFDIYDLPEESFDYHKLMFKKEETLRDLRGLFRPGKCWIPDLNYRVDQGLFNSIARRTAKEWKDVNSENDTTTRNLSQREYESMIRVNALAEIEQFAVACGSTLQDAYDVITWCMFRDTDRKYADLELIRDQLWSAYWIIFGGMAKEAAMMNADIDSFEMDDFNVDEEDDDDEEEDDE